MSATEATIAGGSSILSGGMKIIDSIRKNIENTASNDISASFQIADTISRGENAASTMRIEAMGYDFEALNVRRKLQDEIKMLDNKANAEIGSLKAGYASSGVALSGSALDAIEAAENSVATQRLARQNSADAKAAEREFMASKLRLNAKFTKESIDDSIKRITLNNKISNSLGMSSMAFGIIGDTVDTAFDSVGKFIYKK